MQMLEATLGMARMNFHTRLKKHPKNRFDLEKLNGPTFTSAFQATTGGIFAPPAKLVGEDAYLDSTVTHFNKVVTDTATERLGKQRRKRKP